MKKLIISLSAVIFSIVCYVDVTGEELPKQCEPVNSINGFPVDTSLEIVKSALSETDTITTSTEKLENKIILSVINSKYDNEIKEYYIFADNKLYEYIAAISDPSKEMVESVADKISAKCGTLGEHKGTNYDEFYKLQTTGYFESIIVVTNNKSVTVLLIHGFKEITTPVI